jgi:hypothetical protein
MRCPAHDAVCVCNIPSECGRCYISKTSSSLEVRTKEHKYNLNQGLLEKSKLSRAYAVGHKICWKETKVLQIEPNTTYRKYKKSAHMSLVHLRSVNPAWAPLPLLQQKSENYSSVQCRFYVKTVFLCWYHTENLSL